MARGGLPGAHNCDSPPPQERFSRGGGAVPSVPAADVPAERVHGRRAGGARPDCIRSVSSAARAAPVPPLAAAPPWVRRPGPDLLRLRAAPRYRELRRVRGRGAVSVTRLHWASKPCATSGHRQPESYEDELTRDRL